MEQESSKEPYQSPTINVLFLSIEAPIAGSQTESIDNDSEEHPWD